MSHMEQFRADEKEWNVIDGKLLVTVTIPAFGRNIHIHLMTSPGPEFSNEPLNLGRAVYASDNLYLFANPNHRVLRRSLYHEVAHFCLRGNYWSTFRLTVKTKAWEEMVCDVTASVCDVIAQTDLEKFLADERDHYLQSPDDYKPLDPRKLLG